MSMSMQEIFDKVVLHLRTQKVASMSVNQECMYRNEDGLMCAVGCLIPDSLYTKSIENVRVGDSDVTSILEKAGVIDQADGRAVYEDKVGLLGYLQTLHDVTLSTHPEEVEDSFKNLAIKYQLTYTPPMEVVVNG